MTDTLEFSTYQVYEVGKLIKSSKLKHVWRYSISGSKKELRLLESVVSDKLRIMIQDRVIYDDKPSKRVKAEGISLLCEGVSYKFRKLESGKYDLLIKNERFVPNMVKKINPEASNLIISENMSKLRTKSYSEMMLEAAENEQKERDSENFQNFMKKDDDFLDFKKAEDSDDELFQLENEKSQFCINADSLSFGFKNKEAPSQAPPFRLERPAGNLEKAADSKEMGLKMKPRVKNPSELSKGFDDFMNFDFGRDGARKNSQNSQNVQLSRPAKDPNEGQFHKSSRGDLDQEDFLEEFKGLSSKEEGDFFAIDGGDGEGKNEGKEDEPDFLF